MSKKLQGFVQAYWPIALFIAGAIAGWATLVAQNATVVSTTVRLEAKIDLVVPQVAATQATEQANVSSIADLRQRMLQLEARR